MFEYLCCIDRNVTAGSAGFVPGEFLFEFDFETFVPDFGQWVAPHDRDGQAVNDGWYDGVEHGQPEKGGV